MTRPPRRASSDQILSSERTFFVTTKTSLGRRLLQSERNAMLLIDVLRSCVAAREFSVHDFVVMPDHVHLLITLRADMAIEKAMQLIKGRFSFRLKKEFGYLGEVWQRGYSEFRVKDLQDFLRCQAYIAENPVKAGLLDSAEKYPYCYDYLAAEKASGAEARVRFDHACGATEVAP
jgi:putative transposase